MHIYIDESGIFRNPANKANIASVVAALAVPTSKKKELFKQFRALTHEWRDENGEVKGSNLNEAEIALVISLLQKFDVILELVIIDLGLHTEDEITEYKQIQADKMTEHITDDHHPDVVKRINEIQAVFRSMSNQLFIQAMLMFRIVPRVLLHVIWYYARRIPQELQWFYWMVDAKEQTKTAYEDAWSTSLFPVMAGQSAQNPIVLVEGGDYSYFEKFEERGTDAIRKIEQEKGMEEGELAAIKLGEVIGAHFEFQDSRYNVGLQIADILANAVQRALNGKLRVTGWGEIGRLMMRREPNPVQFIQIKPDVAPGGERRTVKSPFYAVLRLIRAKSKPLWLSPEGEARLDELNTEKNAWRTRPGPSNVHLSQLP
jgi:uncharacterized protein DUF3800